MQHITSQVQSTFICPNIENWIMLPISIGDESMNYRQIYILT